MLNRIDLKFQELRREKKKAFIAFITAGFPSLATTEKFVLGFEKSGVDIVELGIPFSDPLADGPTIQAASQQALEAGVTITKILHTVKKIREKSQIPIALMTYYNPVFHYGEEKFLTDAKKVGVDGLIIPDLPPEEAKALIRKARKLDIATIFFLSPTTTLKRMKHIIQLATGFIYFVSIAGVTGARKALPQQLIAQVQAAKRLTHKPICVGFGVSTPDQVTAVAKFADGVIVGSAIIKQIEQNHLRRDGIARVIHFARSLTRAL